MDTPCPDSLVIIADTDWFLAVTQVDDNLFSDADWVLGNMIPVDRPLPISQEMAQSLISHPRLQAGSIQSFLDGVRHDVTSPQNIASEQEVIVQAAAEVANQFPDVPRLTVWHKAQEYFHDLLRTLGEMPIWCMEEFLEFRTHQLRRCAAQIREANHGKVPLATWANLHQYLGINP